MTGDNPISVNYGTRDHSCLSQNATRDFCIKSSIGKAIAKHFFSWMRCFIYVRERTLSLFTTNRVVCPLVTFLRDAYPPNFLSPHTKAGETCPAVIIHSRARQPLTLKQSDEVTWREKIYICAPKSCKSLPFPCGTALPVVTRLRASQPCVHFPTTERNLQVS